MKLNEYPKAIADLQRDMVKKERQIRSLKESVAIYSANIDRQIAFNNDLKNDAQRKAKRTELMESDADYIEAYTKLQQTQDIYAELEIELQLLLNTFSVLKLERREAIAAMERATSTAA